MRLTWSSEPRERGLSGVMQGERGIARTALPRSAREVAK